MTPLISTSSNPGPERALAILYRAVELDDMDVVQSIGRDNIKRYIREAIEAAIDNLRSAQPRTDSDRLNTLEKYYNGGYNKHCVTALDWNDQPQIDIRKFIDGDISDAIRMLDDAAKKQEDEAVKR